MMGIYKTFKITGKEIKGKNFYSVHFGLENIDGLMDRLKEVDSKFTVSALTLAFPEQNGHHNSLNEGNYPLAGISYNQREGIPSQFTDLIGNREPALFHFFGKYGDVSSKPEDWHMDLVLVQQKHIETYSIEAYISKGGASGNKEIVQEGIKVHANEDYIEGRLGLSYKFLDVEDFSKIEEIIKIGCSLVEDKTSREKYEALEAANSKENTISESELIKILSTPF